MKFSIALGRGRRRLLGGACYGSDQALDGGDALLPERRIYDVEDVGCLVVVVGGPELRLRVFVPKGVVVELRGRSLGVAPRDANDVEVQLANEVADIFEQMSDVVPPGVLALPRRVGSPAY